MPQTDAEVRAAAAQCRHYAMCKIDYLGTGLCPPGRRHHFVSYYPQGRMDLYAALSDGLVPVTEGLVHIADTCTLCGICDLQCHFVTGLRPFPVMRALKDRVGIQVSEIEFLLEKVAMWFAYFQIDRKTRQTVMDFLERQVRDVPRGQGEPPDVEPDRAPVAQLQARLLQHIGTDAHDIARGLGNRDEGIGRQIAEHPLVGEARSVGLIGALELVRDKRTRQFFDKRGEVGTICRDFCFQNGLIMRAVRDTMIISPPLVITREQVDELAEKAWRCLDLTLERCRAEGRM